jgi:hypothetical protein
LRRELRLDGMGRVKLVDRRNTAKEGEDSAGW